jgi:hypothetical protein
LAECFSRESVLASVEMLLGPSASVTCFEAVFESADGPFTR